MNSPLTLLTNPKEEAVKPSLTGFIYHTFETFKRIAYRPFNQIKQRKGKGDKVFSYVPTVDVIDRLQELLSFQWDFEILSEHIEKGEVYCKVRITADINGRAVKKEAYGSQEREMKKDGSSYVNSIGDDLKCACSDGLKKAASLFSVGSHLYRK